MKKKSTRINHIRISKNFFLNEFESPDTKEIKLRPELLKKLQHLRNKIKRSLYINSGYRTKKRNTRVKGAKRSYHMKGMAADIRCPGVSFKALLKAVENLKFGKVIPHFSKKFIHVDIRP